MADIDGAGGPAMLLPSRWFFALGSVLVFCLVLFMPPSPPKGAGAQRVTIWDVYVLSGRQAWGGEGGGEPDLAGLPPASTLLVRHIGISLLGGAAVGGAVFLALNKTRPKGPPRAPGD